MTDSQIVLLLGSIGNALLAGWTAYTVWKDRKDARAHKEKLELLASAKEEKDSAHRHRMEELNLLQKFELEKMTRMVSDAKTVAIETKKDLTKKIDDSKEERRAQIGELSAKVEAGIEQANNYNGKIASLSMAHMAAKATTLQEHANEKLDEIAQNTSPTQKLT